MIHHLPQEERIDKIGVDEILNRAVDSSSSTPHSQLMRIELTIVLVINNDNCLRFNNG